MGNKVKKFKCPICNKVYVSKPSLYEHMSNEHEKDLNGLTPAHYFFNYRNKKDHGNCVICKKVTEFNETTERYERFCSEKCKQKYKDDFHKKMMDKYNDTTLTRDPNFQKKMLKNRKISGTYKWSDGKEFDYTGTYEKDFLEYIDKIMNLNSLEVFSPSPHTFDYEYEGKKHFYIPDFYLAMVNLIVEIKSGTNKHYRERDIEVEKLKDKRLENDKGFNYIKILDKDYKEFTNYFNELIEGNSPI